MASDNIAAFVNKPTFVPGERFHLTLCFDGTVKDLEAVDNVSVDLFRVEIERNQFAFGFADQRR